MNPNLEAPRIDPVPADIQCPLWSVMIPAFNCANFLRQTLSSVLAQDPGPELMHIEVVDDCSTRDDPEAVVRELGKGRVEFHRNPKNTGCCTLNFNICINRSRGQLVHILHGDDLVLPGFYARIEREAAGNTDCAAFFARAFSIEADGTLEALSPRLQPLERPSREAGELLYYNWILTPGVVVRRSFYERTGGYLPELVHVADWEMWLRAIREGSAMSINAPLASYRNFPGNDTARLARTAENLRDLLHLMRILQAKVPELNLPRWEKNLIATGRDQMKKFKSLGMLDAYKANRAFVNELTPSLQTRFLRKASRVSRRLFEKAARSTHAKLDAPPSSSSYKVPGA